MGKLYRLNESQIKLIIDNIINEQRVLPSIKFGDRGDAVTNLQNKIKSLGFNLGTSGPNKDGVDGVFGNRTKNALITLQKKFGLKQTGEYDHESQMKLANFGTPVMGMTGAGGVTKTGTTQTKGKTVPVNQKYPMCIKGSPIKKGRAVKGSKEYAMEIENHVFYVNGRVMTPDGTMGNYYCYDNGVKVQLSNKVYYVDTGVKTEKNETGVFSGGIKGMFRRAFPNIAEMFFTRPLTGQDFTENQKKIMYDCIQNAIKRDPKKNTKQKGSTEYSDYGPGYAEKLEGTGPSTVDTVLGTATDDKFRVATTLGRFSYQLQSNGNYLVTDKYDFSKAKAYTIKPEEVKGMNFAQKYQYISRKTDLSPYRVFRHIAYLEHPDSAPESTKTSINVLIQPGNFV